MRVIAGQLGGRTIRAPGGRRTRPTSDRVREALFSLLGELTDHNVLDLYAGSGALGIEALSRGAARATFVETWSGAAQVLSRNLAELELAHRSTLLRLPVERALPRLLGLGPFDLVFCDPPWTDLEHAKKTLAELLVPELLAAGARLVVEHPADEPFSLAPMPPGSELEPERTRHWGDTAVSIFANRGPPPAGSHRGL
jgi:16S rRNA (guanine966-N2)-methyltransferase